MTTGRRISSSLIFGILGHGLRAFADRVFGQLAGQQQSDGGLDLAASDRGTICVLRQPVGFRCDAVEDVIDEAVHDAHRFGRETGVGMHLLQHFVDVHGKRFFSFEHAVPSPSLRVHRFSYRLGGWLVVVVIRRFLRDVPPFGFRVIGHCALCVGIQLRTRNREW